MDALKWKLPKCRIRHRFTWLTLFTVIGSVIYTIFIFKGLPDKIPIHFNLKGEADHWGNKAIIFLTPLGFLPAFALVFALSKMPHYFHEGTLTEKDKEKYMAIAKYMSIANFIISLLVFYIIWSIARIAHEKYALEPWALLLLMGVLIVLTIHYGLKTKNWKS